MLLLFACSAALCACASGGATSAGQGAPPAKAMGAGPALLQEVRAAGKLGNELDVQPLRDPQVEDLRAIATAAEAKGDYAGARNALARALELSPKDPELLQWSAEMALVAHDWPRAQQLAMESHSLGPKLGGLCRRNFTILRLAAEARGDAAAASQAQQQAGACAVAPPTRY
jgi:tetratricopeptide (TPR) repeat protein